MTEKKVKFSIQGTAYIDGKYCQQDMVDFNKNKTIPKDIADAINASIFGRKRTYHLSIIGDKSIDYKEIFFDTLEKFENKYGIITKRHFLNFMDSAKIHGTQQKTTILEEMMNKDCSAETFIETLNLVASKNIYNINYFRKILSSAIQKAQHNRDRAQGLTDWTSEVMEKLDRYNI